MFHLYSVVLRLFPRRPNAWLAVALLILAMVASLPAREAPTPESTDLETPTPLAIAGVEVDPDYDQMLRPEKRGFQGADGAASVALADDKVLWIFGDTILGMFADGKRKGPMVRNTIAIQDLSVDPASNDAVTYYWDFTDKLMGDFFPPKPFDAPYWYWPGTGFMRDGRLYLLLHKMAQGDGPAGFSFQTIDTTLFRISNPLDDPTEWSVEEIDLGVGDDHFGVSSAALPEGEYVYLLGYHDGAEKAAKKRVSILARTPVSDLDSDAPIANIEYWSMKEGDTDGFWSPTVGDITPIFLPGGTESSLHFDPLRKRYISVTVQPFTSNFYLFSAESLTGPWSAPQTIYRIPELDKDDNYVAYAGRAHPMLSKNPNELSITYVVNTKDFWSMFSDPSIYYPRFIRVTFE